MRQYWKHYYKGMQGLVFVVDSASSNEDMDVAVTGLRDAIFNRDLVCVPCLILANCQDKPDARSYDEVMMTCI